MTFEPKCKRVESMLCKGLWEEHFQKREQEVERYQGRKKQVFGQTEPIEIEAQGTKQKMVKDANEEGGRAGFERPWKPWKGIWTLGAAESHC